MDFSLKEHTTALTGFQQLQQAAIDASSIIYLTQAGCFSLVSRVVQLYSLPEIQAEVGFSVENISLVKITTSDFTIDEKLLSLAITAQLPVISDDKKLLAGAQRAGLPFYNSLMMLNFLVFKSEIETGAYFEYLNRLKQFARYHSTVWEFGAKVFQLILSSRPI